MLFQHPTPDPDPGASPMTPDLEARARIRHWIQQQDEELLYTPDPESAPETETPLEARLRQLMSDLSLFEEADDQQLREQIEGFIRASLRECLGHDPAPAP